MYVTACILHVWIQTPELVYLAVCAFAMHLCGSLGGHASACVCVCVCARACARSRARSSAQVAGGVSVSGGGPGPGTPGQAFLPVFPWLVYPFLADLQTFLAHSYTLDMSILRFAAHALQISPTFDVTHGVISLNNDPRFKK